jgi:hypothetical protein
MSPGEHNPARQQIRLVAHFPSTNNAVPGRMIFFAETQIGVLTTARATLF